MDYKKIIKSRDTRLKLLKMLSWIPDEVMLKVQYRIKTGRPLDLKNPKRYTEKLQWYKIFYRDPLMIQCVDKYDVRAYVEKCGLEQTLVPCFGVYDAADQIDWSSLPRQFVLKDTLGGGGNSVIIVEDKGQADIPAIMSQIRQWTQEDAHIPSGGREWPYYCGKNHRIIIEAFIDSNRETGGLIDYKFLCCNGKVVLLYVLADRVTGQGAGCGFFTPEFEKLPYTESDEKPLARDIPKPDNYREMYEIAERLAKDFPLARIDLYNANGQILFGEITFYDSSGYMTFDPDEVDFMMGDKFRLPEKSV